MNRAEILEAFGRLSAEEKEAVRTELITKSTAEEACCSPSMTAELAKMMKQMEASEDPMTMCQTMMRMCCEKVGEQKTCK